MSQVSKNPISEEVAERIFSVFITSIVRVKNREEAEAYASDLFSPSEKVMLAKRIAIAFLLLKKYQYREISKLLKVSLTTIASVNLTLQTGKGGYKKILTKIMEEENLEEFFAKMTSTVLSLPAFGTKGSGAWKYLHNEVKQEQKKKKKAF